MPPSVNPRELRRPQPPQQQPPPPPQGLAAEKGKAEKSANDIISADEDLLDLLRDAELEKLADQIVKTVGKGKLKNLMAVCSGSKDIIRERLQHQTNMDPIEVDLLLRRLDEAASHPQGATPSTMSNLPSSSSDRGSISSERHISPPPEFRSRSVPSSRRASSRDGASQLVSNSRRASSRGRGSWLLPHSATSPEPSRSRSLSRSRSVTFSDMQEPDKGTLFEFAVRKILRDKRDGSTRFDVDYRDVFVSKQETDYIERSTATVSAEGLLSESFLASHAMMQFPPGIFIYEMKCSGNTFSRDSLIKKAVEQQLNPREQTLRRRHDENESVEIHRVVVFSLLDGESAEAAETFVHTLVNQYPNIYFYAVSFDEDQARQCWDEFGASVARVSSRSDINVRACFSRPEPSGSSGTEGNVDPRMLPNGSSRESLSQSISQDAWERNASEAQQPSTVVPQPPLPPSLEAPEAEYRELHSDSMPLLSSESHASASARYEECLSSRNYDAAAKQIFRALPESKKEEVYQVLQGIDPSTIRNPSAHLVSLCQNGGGGGGGNANLSKIFVGRLPKTSTESDIDLYFSRQYGPVSEVFIPRDSAGESKGFCFVSFADESSVVQALNNHATNEIGGRWVDVQRKGTGKGGGKGGGKGSLVGRAVDTQVQSFIAENALDERATNALRRATPEHQQYALDRGTLSDANNPSSVVITRLRDAAGFLGSSGGASSSSSAAPFRIQQ